MRSNGGRGRTFARATTGRAAERAAATARMVHDAAVPRRLASDRITARLATVLALLIGGVMIFAGPGATAASADDELLQAYPADGSTVTEPVNEIRLSFADPIGSGSSVVVIGPDGAEYADGAPQVMGDINLVQPVRPLAPGRYQVRWTFATGRDRATQGGYSFTMGTVQAAAVAPATTPAYQPGGSGEWTVIGLVALVALALFLVAVRRRYRREVDLPPYRPDRGHDF